jgi:hypothetical protein
MAEKRKVSLGRKFTRAFFIGMEIGLLGGLGLYLMAKAVNAMAAQAVLDPVGFLLIGLGGCLVAAFGIELSGDIAESS